MSDISSLFSWFKDLFFDLFNMTIGSSDNKVRLLIIVPIFISSALIFFFSFVIPFLLNFNTRLDFESESLNENLEKSLRKFKHFSTFDFDSVNGFDNFTLKKIIKRPFSWLRFKNNQKSLEKSVVLQKVYDEYRQEFEEIYGIKPNNSQLQQFIRSGGFYKFWRKKKNTRAKVSDTFEAEVVVNGQTVNVSSKNGKTTISVNSNQLEQDNGVAVQTDAPQIENE